MKKLAVSVFVFACLLLSGLFLAESTRAQQPQFLFYKGVVTNGDCEQSSQSITVTIGTNVQYCYRLGNTGQSPSVFTVTITDDKLGLVGGDPTFAGSLQAGQSVVFTKTASIATHTVNTAFLSGTMDTGTGTLTATIPLSDTSMATVNVQQGSAVPAFSEWGLVLFMLLIVFTSLYTLRKRIA
jgi:hypothetical protein